MPVIRHTWGPDAGDSLVLFSDVEDPAYGTVFQGVPNTAKGHCAKTMAIIGKMDTVEQWKGLSWLVIVDDDTLLRYIGCTSLCDGVNGCTGPYAGGVGGLKEPLPPPPPLA